MLLPTWHMECGSPWVKRAELACSRCGVWLRWALHSQFRVLTTRTAMIREPHTGPRVSDNVCSREIFPCESIRVSHEHMPCVQHRDRHHGPICPLEASPNARIAHDVVDVGERCRCEATDLLWEFVYVDHACVPQRDLKIVEVQASAKPWWELELRSELNLLIVIVGEHEKGGLLGESWAIVHNRTQKCCESSARRGRS